jgi:ESCRT-I complex subunit VPS28
MECPRATERLRIGLPLTLTNPTHSSSTQPNASQSSAAPSFHPSTSAVLLATETFITFLDGLKLGLASKDQLHPLLSEVIQAVNKVTEADFEGRGSIVKWLIRLNGMRAQEELPEGEARECAFEMEQAYGGFKSALGA